ncbi:MAG: hypothetical protein RBR84_11895 [Bacteroidales bacterium]|jgi:hypothetical protein|nr:hypothetical protein [Bacteroidales bacterium]
MSVKISFQFLAVFIFTGFLLSCNKDNIQKKSLIAGDTTDVAVYKSFNPPLEFELIWDEQNLYGNAIDSLDVNQDQLADVFFRLVLLNPDSLHLLNGEMPNPFPSFHIYSHDSVFETATTTETVYVGLGTTTNFYWVDTLNGGQIIDETLQWRPANTWGEKLWSENPVSMLSNGPWFEKNQPAFLAFRIRGAMGWIKIDTYQTNNPKIIAFALQSP